MTQKWVYLLSEGKAQMLDLLGGKGAGLAEMIGLGLPVPPGFTITTQACSAYYAAAKQFPKGMWEQVLAALQEVEKQTGKRFGNPDNPLLLSVRSGAKVSMPGMMDTITDLGLSDEIVQGLVHLMANERFAYDVYRRLIQAFCRIVFRIPEEELEPVLGQCISVGRAHDEASSNALEFKAICAALKKSIRDKKGVEFPEDPYTQLKMAIEAVFDSWFSPRAMDYRKFHGISHDLGTAVTVQAMVFGNLGLDSGTGVAFTRDPGTGEHVIYGEYCLNAQGEDVVSGAYTPRSLEELESTLPQAHDELVQACQTLERHFRDMQDVEFTIEQGQLWVLQTRAGKRTSRAAVKIAVDMVEEGLIAKQDALQRVRPSQLDQFRCARFDPEMKAQAIAEGRLVARGLGASPGVAVGTIVFDADAAVEQGQQGKAVVLVRPQTSPADVGGMLYAKAIVASRGGATSHAALVARSLDKPCVVGCGALKIDLENRAFSVDDLVVREGDVLSVDGSAGEIFIGQIATIEPKRMEFPELSKFLLWLNEFRRRSVWMTAAYPRDVGQARDFRTEATALWESSPWVTEKAKVIELLKLIPQENHILQVPVSAKDKDTLREIMLDVVQKGYWVGLRTCYHPEQPLGRAPWHMAITTRAEVEEFLANPEFGGFSGSGGHSKWLEDPNLREIIVLHNPPELGLPQHVFEKRHFVFTVSCHSQPDEVLVEISLDTAQVRSIERAEPRDLIHIIMHLDPSGPQFKGPRIFCFGRKHLKQKELERVTIGVNKAAKYVIEFIDNDDIRAIWASEEGRSSVEKLYDEFLSRREGPKDIAIKDICRRVLAVNGGFGLGNLSEEGIGIKVREAMCREEFTDEMYEKLVKAKALRITKSIAEMVFDKWWEPPFELPHVMQALEGLFNLHTLEVQGRCKQNGKVEYMLVYEFRGREEKIEAERAAIAG